MKKIIEWLKTPRIWWYIIVLLLLGACIAGTVLILIYEQDSPFAYLLYALSAILLPYFVYATVKLGVSARKSVKAWAEKYGFTRKLIQHYGFRTIVFAAVSFAISIAYAAFNLTIGIINLSVWFIALGAYYALLALMRGGILIYHRNKKSYDEQKSKIKDIKSFTVSGAVLTVLPVALSATISEIVGEGMAFERAGLLIYVAAAYTFYKVIMSVYNFAKARKSDEMTVRAVRNINLADSLVSVLALQTAMFREFAGGENMGYANAVTGAAVCALTALIGVLMIINGAKALRKTRSGLSDEQ